MHDNYYCHLEKEDPSRMLFPETPTWVWIGFAVLISPAVLLFLMLIYEFVGPRPYKTVQLRDFTIELWVRERKYPRGADAIIVPVAPDLKMVTGIAKWVRDATANRVQYEADRVAPLPPGEAFVGSGGKYRFKIAALAVVMDEYKRTTPEWIIQATTRAMELANEKGAETCVLPDMTEDLLRQPQSISEEERRKTCEGIAPALVQALIKASNSMELVRIWVWRRGVEDIYLKELERLQEATQQPVGHPSAALHST
jgi:O-acetyl-ADP-ribose deacetylase (regulator of RNase III)